VIYTKSGETDVDIPCVQKEADGTFCEHFGRMRIINERWGQFSCWGRVGHDKLLSVRGVADRRWRQNVENLPPTLMSAPVGCRQLFPNVSRPTAGLWRCSMLAAPGGGNHLQRVYGLRRAAKRCLARSQIRMRWGAAFHLPRIVLQEEMEGCP
jgi:hypothetical protein